MKFHLISSLLYSDGPGYRSWDTRIYSSCSDFLQDTEHWELEYKVFTQCRALRGPQVRNKSTHHVHLAPPELKSRQKRKRKLGFVHPGSYSVIHICTCWGNYTGTKSWTHLVVSTFLLHFNQNRLLMLTKLQFSNLLRIYFKYAINNIYICLIHWIHNSNNLYNYTTNNCTAFFFSIKKVFVNVLVLGITDWLFFFYKSQSQTKTK